MKDKEQSKAETWLKERYSEQLIFQNLEFLAGMCEEYVSQFKSQQSVITEGDIDEKAEDYASMEDSNRQHFIDGSSYEGFVDGAKWAIARMNTDKRELLVGFAKLTDKDYALNEKYWNHKVDELLNTK